jgi:hypothetical protein
LVLSWIGLAPTTPGLKAEDVTLRGQVLTLAAALEALGAPVNADAESITKQVVLVMDDRTITPLFLDDASRAFFRDERLRGCRTEIRGRRFAGVPFLQVVTFRIERDGRFGTPEYYCEVCAISVRYPQTCPCCQGSMELRLKPD